MPQFTQPLRDLMTRFLAGGVIFAGTCATASTQPAALINIDASTQLIHLPAPVRITHSGLIEVATSKWNTETDTEGTQLLTAKTAEARAALIKSPDGKPESFTAYTLTQVGPESAKTKQEDSGTIFYSNGHVAAVTSCTNSGLKESIGRICVTATPRLCQRLRSTKGIDNTVLNEMESFEKRSLAAILTLRGNDHQLDNIVNSGNRLGLKNALQTTKGQILALESHASPPESEKKILDSSLPRLRKSCLVSRF